MPLSSSIHQKINVDSKSGLRCIFWTCAKNGTVHRALSWVMRTKPVCKCKYNEAVLNKPMQM